MTQALRVHTVALHVEELARDCVWPDYIEKLINAARDLELRAAQLTGERAAVPDG